MALQTRSTVPVRPHGIDSGRHQQADAVQDEPHGGHGGAFHFGPIRILVADGFPPTRAGVRLALEREGCLVSEASSVPAALEAASRDRPDVCLIDTELPGGAIEALLVLAERLPGTAIVMFARSPSGAELLRCVEAGAWGYLPKQIDPARLSVALQRVAEGEAAVPRTLMTTLIEDLRERARRRRLPLVRDLTTREFEVLDLMRRGLATGEIAGHLHIAKVTVRTHIASILRKLAAADRETAIHQLDRR